MVSYFKFDRFVMNIFIVFVYFNFFFSSVIVSEKSILLIKFVFEIECVFIADLQQHYDLITAYMVRYENRLLLAFT